MTSICRVTVVGHVRLCRHCGGCRCTASACVVVALPPPRVPGRPGISDAGDALPHRRRKEGGRRIHPRGACTLLLLGWVGLHGAAWGCVGLRGTGWDWVGLGCLLIASTSNHTLNHYPALTHYPLNHTRARSPLTPHSITHSSPTLHSITLVAHSQLTPNSLFTPGSLLLTADTLGA